MSQPITEASPSAHLNSILTIFFEGAWDDTIKFDNVAEDLLSYFLYSHFFSKNFSKGGSDSYFFLSGSS